MNNNKMNKLSQINSLLNKAIRIANELEVNRIIMQIDIAIATIADEKIDTLLQQKGSEI